MKYMLDTNICIYIIANRSIEVVQKFRQVRNGYISLSVVVASELAYGVAKSQWKEKNRITLDSFLNGVVIQAMPESVVWHYAELRCHLERTGQIIGENDQWIAAHALATDSVLVTNNTREFARVPGLKLENWL